MISARETIQYSTSAASSRRDLFADRVPAVTPLIARSDGSRRVTGQHRSTQRRLPARGRGDDALRTELHAFSRGHPRRGYRRAWAALREKGWGVNRKRVQRL